LFLQIVFGVVPIFARQYEFILNLVVSKLPMRTFTTWHLVKSSSLQVMDQHPRSRMLCKFGIVTGKSLARSLRYWLEYLVQQIQISDR
jgi:hypothetical protein